MTEPVLLARGARLVVDDATVVPELDLRTSGDRVLLAGQPAALLAALIRGTEPQARVAAGSLQLCGADVGSGQHLARAGLAPLDPLLPGPWTVEEYLRWSARLAGVTAREAGDRAAAVIERLGLAAGRRRSLKTLRVADRRVVVLGHALVMDPEVIVCEAPLRDLDAADSQLVGHALALASAERAAVISVGQLGPPGPETELVRGATDLCLMHGDALVLHTAPAEAWLLARVAELTVRANGARLQECLADAGAVVHGGPIHFAVQLPPTMGLTDLLGWAARARAPVVRCTPLWAPPPRG